VIAGGESGPRHHPVDLEWVRELRDAFIAGVPFFMSVARLTGRVKLVVD